MTKISFIYTEKGFIPDHPEDHVEDAWATRFLQNKYEALFDFGFEHDTKGFSGSALFLYHISETFIQVLSAKPELEIAREQIRVPLDEHTIDTLLNIVPFCIGNGQQHNLQVHPLESDDYSMDSELMFSKVFSK